MSLCNLCHRRRPRKALALARRSSAAFTAAERQRRVTLRCFEAWNDSIVAQIHPERPAAAV